MNISILNSRFGPDERQLEGFRRLIPRFDKASTVFHHGADRADLKIHSMLRMVGFQIIGHPVKNRDEFEFDLITEFKDPKNVTERNRELVDTSDMIIVMAQAMNEFEDSPQWKTVRAAFAANKQIYVVSPHGYCYEVLR